jgi:hypothetical protein
LRSTASRGPLWVLTAQERDKREPQVQEQSLIATREVEAGDLLDARCSR